MEEGEGEYTAWILFPFLPFLLQEGLQPAWLTAGLGGALLMAEWNPGDSGPPLHPLAPLRELSSLLAPQQEPEGLP